MVEIIAVQGKNALGRSRGDYPRDYGCPDADPGGWSHGAVQLVCDRERLYDDTPSEKSQPPDGTHSVYPAGFPRK